MFVKTTKAKNFEYVKLVESYREQGTVKHRVLFNFGRLDVIKENKMFINVVKKLCELIEISTEKDFYEKLSSCSEADIFLYGHMAYKKLWEDLGIASILRNIQNNSKIQFSLVNTALLMATQALLSPRSKLSTWQHQDEYWCMNDIDLHHLYRTLDYLVEHKNFIEKSIFDINYSLNNKQVDVVFYDVTTFAFESVKTDEIRNFGFSKDQKFKEVQVVMGLMIDSQGLPVGYELFPGNTFDGKTLVKSLDNIKSRFGIKRVIIVADRGINSKSNLKHIKDAGYDYIVASKLRGSKKELQKQIFNSEGYVETSENFRYKKIDFQNIVSDEEGEKHILKESLIISYSKKRADKDRSDRNRLTEKAKKLLRNPSAINAESKRGGKKYLKETSSSKNAWYLDIQKINEDSKFDGYYGIQTSELNMSPLEIIEAYHSLWKIEESFRVMKSTLEVRPVFHWTPKRIEGHFVLCFLAFFMERHLEVLLIEDCSETDDIPSPLKIREAINSMRLAKITVNEENLYLKTKNDSLGTKIFQKLKLQFPKNINKEAELKSCFFIRENDLWGQLSLF